MSKYPKVFISYAHDTELFSDKVLEFSNKLRENWIDANIDQYEEAPAEGWPRWMDRQIEEADYVLVICTEAYFNKVKLYELGEGKGVNWEINIIYQHLYDSCCSNTKFIPVVLNGYHTNNILKPLKSSTVYYVDRQKEFNKLCNRIKGIKNVSKPALGPTEKALKQKERKNIFVTSFIDIDVWDSAKWGAVSYLFDSYEENPPIIGLTFENGTSGIKIFRDWKHICKDNYFDELSMSVIEDDKGYFVYISSNVDKYVERLIANGLEVKENLIVTFSRYNYMNACQNSNNLSKFKEQYEKLKEYYIAPAFFKNGSRQGDISNIEFNFDYIIKMSSIKFLKKDELTINDPEYCVIQRPNPPVKGMGK